MEMLKSGCRGKIIFRLRDSVNLKFHLLLQHCFYKFRYAQIMFSPSHFDLFTKVL